MNTKALLLRISAFAFIVGGMSLESLAQNKLALDNKDFKVIEVRGCFDEFDSGVYPAVKIVFISKRRISYLEFNGTFISMSDNSSLGRDAEAETYLEPGVKYTIKLKANQGWVLFRGQRVSIKIYAKIAQDNLNNVGFTQYQLASTTIFGGFCIDCNY